MGGAVALAILLPGFRSQGAVRFVPGAYSFSEVAPPSDWNGVLPRRRNVHPAWHCRSRLFFALGNFGVTMRMAEFPFPLLRGAAHFSPPYSDDLQRPIVAWAQVAFYYPRMPVKFPS